MRIEICDLCQKVQNTNLVNVRMIYFMYGEDWLGKPQKTRCICSSCLDLLFNKKGNA